MPNTYTRSSEFPQSGRSFVTYPSHAPRKAEEEMKHREHRPTQPFGQSWSRTQIRHLAISVARLAQPVVVGLLAFSISGCFEEEKVGISYVGVNHTNKDIVSIIVNGEGGILNVSAQNAGSEMCCVILPRKWKPGQMVAIKWREDGDFQRDENGQLIVRDGKNVYVPAPWKSKSLELPAYDEQQIEGRFYIHFYPSDDVKVTVNKFGPGHINHPYPSPRRVSEH